MVILSAAKNLTGVAKILRCAQNDEFAKKNFHTPRPLPLAAPVVSDRIALGEAMEDFDRDDEIENGEETGWRLPRFQFSLAALLWIVTGVAVLSGLIAWWGLVPVMFLIGSAGGTFLGLLVCNYFELGFGFEDLRADILKCVLIPAASLGGWWLMSSIPFGPWMVRSALIINFFIYWIGMKLAWPDIELHEILICCISALFAGLGLIALVYSIYPLH
jgi:hypothetical protein